ncbi:MAG: 4Fe-4S binding protein [Candidatus Xenobium sp.]|jgi:MinD superfamily P-loop ATPase|nr:4Fe-4S binding protein [Burkholderiales bacterium]
MAEFTLAIASGKGGTGKTLISTNLGVLAAEEGLTVLVDCDAEAPNGHLFFPQGLRQTHPVQVPIAQVQASLCTACGLCRDACAFGAIRMLGKAQVFEELCHPCGVCVSVCPTGAIREIPQRIGEVEILRPAGREHLILVTSRLDTGQVKTPNVIQAARRTAGQFPARIVLLDAPPGVACAAVASLRGADAILLVTEPTVFGLHDLELSIQLGRSLDIPMAVLVNRDVPGDTSVEALCRSREVPIVARIPFNREVAETYARGGLIVEEFPAFRELLGPIPSLMRGLRAGKGIQA